MARNTRAIQRSVLALVPIVLVQLVGASRADAFVTPFQLSALRIYYSIDSSFTSAGFITSVLYESEQAWKAADLLSHGELYNNQSLGGGRTVSAGGIDGKFGTSAIASLPCANNSSTCSLKFDTAESWNTTDEIRGNTWQDFRTLATQEFGHWLGLDHSCDTSGTDGSRLSSMCNPINYGTIRRSIVADDASGLAVARQGSGPYTIANSSFEYGFIGQYPNGGWGFLKNSSGGGSATRYCNNGAPAYVGVCFVEFNGNGASVYQDFSIRPGWETSRSIEPYVEVRNRSDAGKSVTIAFWYLDGSATAISTTCVLPAATWNKCSAGVKSYKTGNVKVRFQVYSNTATNIDVDAANVRWQ